MASMRASILFAHMVGLSSFGLAHVSVSYVDDGIELLMLKPSLPRALVTLARVSSGVVTALGRSYDGRDWEGVAPTYVHFDCATDSTAFCTVNLSSPACLPAPNTDIGGGYRFQISNFSSAPALPSNATAAQFLLQATFGPTRGTVANLTYALDLDPADAISNWLSEQMRLPPSLHREYYRQRTNARLTAPVGTGGVRSPCAPSGSRWHRHAFTEDDVGRSINGTALSGSGYTLSVDGVARTDVYDIGSAAFDNTDLVVCSVSEHVGGAVAVGTDCNMIFPNPAILFNATSPTVGTSQTLTSIAAVDLSEVPGGQGSYASDGPPGGFSILRRWNVPCNLPTVGAAFLRYDGKFYKHDRRLELLENTATQPATIQVGSAGGATQCPAVTRSFSNEAGCVRQQACSAVEYSSTILNLNSSMLQKFYRIGGRYVYYVDNLRLESPFAESPCAGISRWRKHSNICSAETVLDSDTRATIGGYLQGHADHTEYVRDIEIVTGTCLNQHNGVSTIGTKINVDGVCWEHVHPDLYNVYDFTYWTVAHPGTSTAMDNGRPNPIKTPAESFTTSPAACPTAPSTRCPVLNFPSWHIMKRWKDERDQLTYIGKLGENFDFRYLPTSVQTEELATHIGALGETVQDGSEACGSPGEVANDPSKGHRYHIHFAKENNDNYDLGLYKKYNNMNGKKMVWTMNALNAPDQLRQRMAWALSQIYVISSRSREIEPPTAHYDIYIRNAFGSLRDVIREVSYSPVMSKYLTYLENRKFSSRGTYPDENYARESMQLFSIGLVKLNLDGSVQTDRDGRPIDTYDTADIQTMARLWTGFDLQAPRGNIAHYTGDRSKNLIDPLKVNPEWRDVLPKTDLYDGYIGDYYPLCEDLPNRMFLRKSSRYMYLAERPVSRLQGDNGIIAPNATDSDLHAVLCKRNSGTGHCEFPSEVVLQTNIACAGLECFFDTVRVVQITDAVANRTVFFEYVPLACVSMQFYDNATQIKGQYDRVMCANPLVAAAGSACCVSATSTNAVAQPTCRYHKEKVTFDTAFGRCADLGMHVCDRFDKVDRDETCEYGNEGSNANPSRHKWAWQTRECQLQIQIQYDGMIGMVHSHPSVLGTWQDGASDNDNPETQLDSHNTFRVAWVNGSFPKPGTPDCSAPACTAHVQTCICHTSVQTLPVFTDFLPTRDQILEHLRVGSPAPDVFDSGTYFRCLLESCTNQTGVEIWTRGGVYNLDTSTIFRVISDHGVELFLRNKAVTVRIPQSRYEFRNPPSFMNMQEQTRRDAIYETEALIDHLFHHPNVAPFISYRLIQRFTTSNPSPRYTKAVATAFAVGQYAGHGTGNYGDLSATIAAILLDPEARSPTLQMDATHGRLREPLIKVLHVMRALEFVSKDDREVEFNFLENRIGMMAHTAPSVFNFYLPEYQPPGPVADAGLVSPEAELATTPLVKGFLNTMLSLLRWGLTSCSSGSGSVNVDRQCHTCTGGNQETNDGYLAFKPTGADTFENVTCFRVACGARNNCGSQSHLSCATPEQRYHVSCCADTAVSGFRQRDTCPGVWGERDANGMDCSGEVTHEAAVQFCTSMGGRLCTSAELDNDCAKNTGCGSNSAYHWTSDQDIVMQPCTVDTDTVLAELDLLLTGSRSNLRSMEIIRRSYEATLSTPVYCARQTSHQNSVIAAGSLMLATPEFHSTNAAALQPTDRLPEPAVQSQNRSYKAVVVLFLNGGCDSFNVLVPHSNCEAKDMYTEYANVRGEAKLSRSSMEDTLVDVPTGTQPCATFGIHPELPLYKRLYDQGDAAFIANIGTLIEPLTKVEFNSMSKQIPPSLFAHNTQQRQAQSVHAQLMMAKGVLGRIKAALTTKQEPFATSVYSVHGNMKITEGPYPPNIISHANDGVEQITNGLPTDLIEQYYNITSRESGSVFGETYSRAIEAMLHETSRLGDAMAGAAQNLLEDFGDEKLEMQLKQVAKLISLRQQLQSERDLFVVKIDGFDTHSDLDEQLAGLLEIVNRALTTFVAEIQGAGLWNNVTIVTVSDFGRTLTSNGVGTDHAWGGNHIVMGGAVLGGRVHGQYPDTLTDHGDRILNRGRVIPTIPWEGMWYGISQWIGVASSDLETVLPNINNFAVGSTLLTDKQIFDCNVTSCADPEPELEPQSDPDRASEPCAEPAHEDYAPLGQFDRFVISNDFGNISAVAVPEMRNRSGVIIRVTSVCGGPTPAAHLVVDMSGTAMVELAPRGEQLVGVTETSLMSFKPECSGAIGRTPEMHTVPLICSATLLQVGVPWRMVLAGNLAAGLLRAAHAHEFADGPINIVVYHSPDAQYTLAFGSDTAELVRILDAVNCTGIWSPWTSCSADCGGGISHRQYNVTAVAANGGVSETCDAPHNTIESRHCNSDPCAADCVGQWNAWSQCNVSCGSGSQERYYSVSRISAYGGTNETCEAADGARQIEPCNEQHCPVHCEGEFSAWSACSSGCGGGTRTRTFNVIQIAASGGSNATCAADPGSVEEQPCNTQPCPEPCVGEWSAYTSCNAACGGGLRTRTFSISEAAVAGGAACAADDGEIEEQQCNLFECPVDCVGSWSSWGDCDKSCGGGTKSREYLVAVTAAYGGNISSCQASNASVQHMQCNVHSCPQNCRGNFSDWGICSQSCDTGTRTRIYRVEQPAAYGGSNSTCLHGDGVSETAACNTHACSESVNCSGYWNAWSSCSSSCGGGSRSRTYFVGHYATEGGANSTCTHAHGDVESEVCGSEPCPPPPINCEGAWAAWSDCDRECGSGSQSQRFVVSIAAQHGGHSCEVSNQSQRFRVCNTQPCPVTVPAINCAGSWSSWSTCSSDCSVVSKTRIFSVVTPASIGGTNSTCAAAHGDVETEICHALPCPIDCDGYWEPWSVCDAPCGGGAQMQTFQVTRAAANGGTDCTESLQSPRIQTCNTQQCSSGGIEHLVEIHAPCEETANIQWKQLFASELASALQSLLDLTVDQMTDRLEVRRVGCGSTLVTLFVAAGDPSVEVLSEGIAGLAWLAQQELVSARYPRESTTERTAAAMLRNFSVLTVPILAHARLGRTLPTPTRYMPPEPPSLDRDDDGCLNEQDAFPDDPARCLEVPLPSEPNDNNVNDHADKRAHNCNTSRLSTELLVAIGLVAAVLLFAFFITMYVCYRRGRVSNNEDGFADVSKTRAEATGELRHTHVHHHRHRHRTQLERTKSP